MADSLSGTSKTTWKSLLALSMQCINRASTAWTHSPMVSFRFAQARLLIYVYNFPSDKGLLHIASGGDDCSCAYITVSLRESAMRISSVTKADAHSSSLKGKPKVLKHRRLDFNGSSKRDRHLYSSTLQCCHHFNRSAAYVLAHVPG